MLLAFLLVPAIAWSQASPAPSLILADRITFSEVDGLLVADGNVQIVYDGISLSAASLTYDSVNGTINATGPIILTDSDGTRIFADTAALSPDLVDGLIRGARILLANRFQFASAEVRRTEGRYTTLFKTVGSSCNVCFDRPVPIWQIRAERVIHDRVEKTLYFSDAKIEFFGLTVLRLPYLRMPDPTVARASGLLNPEFLSGDLFGYGVKLPYYLVLGEQSDATITPFLASRGTVILEGEYRRMFRNGSFNIDGALALRDGITNEDLRGYLRTDAQISLGQQFILDIETISVSDEAFLRQFGYSDQDRLTSSAIVSRYRTIDYTELGVVVFQSLRDDEVYGTIPVILPEFAFRRHVPTDRIGGQLSVGANAVGLVRSDGRDVYRLGLSADWQGSRIFANGFVAEAFARADLNVYRVFDDAAFDQESVLSFVSPTVGAKLGWPMVRQSAAALEVFEPIVQVIYTGQGPGNDTVPNEDSQQIEFDETNLFSFNRYPGLDRAEAGLRINVGANYSLARSDGWNIAVFAGQVFRINNDSPFSEGSGLGTQVSDLLGALIVELPPDFRMINRVLFDDALDFKRAESQVLFRTESYDFEASYLHLDADANAGAPDTRDEISLGGNWQFRPNWQVSANARYNLTEDIPIDARGSLAFGNECIRVELSVSRSYTTSDNVPPATNYGLTLNLAGFGGAAEERWPAAGCRRQ